MCGFCGVVSPDKGSHMPQAAIMLMRETLTHRGPDDAGCHVEPGVALGSRRLAVLDLSERGHMPMRSADGRYWLAYNGEVYNHRALRSEFQSDGYDFRSNTDTETLLYLYDKLGPSMLDRLNGMFALALWDTHERTLFLARDRLGVKPLYYAFRDGALYFASEEKALFAAGIPANFDHSTVGRITVLSVHCWRGDSFCRGAAPSARSLHDLARRADRDAPLVEPCAKSTGGKRGFTEGPCRLVQGDF